MSSPHDAPAWPYGEMSGTALHSALTNGPLVCDKCGAAFYASTGTARLPDAVQQLWTHKTQFHPPLTLETIAAKLDRTIALLEGK